MAQAKTWAAFDVHVSGVVAAMLDRDSGELRVQRWRVGVGTPRPLRDRNRRRRTDRKALGDAGLSTRRVVPGAAQAGAQRRRDPLD